MQSGRSTAPIDHDCCFRGTNGGRGPLVFIVCVALASVVTGTPLECNGYISEARFCGAVAAWLGSATHAVATVLVAAIAIAVGDADGGAEGIIY